MVDAFCDEHGRDGSTIHDVCDMLSGDPSVPRHFADVDPEGLDRSSPLEYCRLVVNFQHFGLPFFLLAVE